MEKRLYLINLAGQLPMIREKLGWTQEELARRLGLSRANVNGIEQYPERLGKTTALALYMAVFGELGLKRRQFASLDYTLWDLRQPDRRQILLRHINAVTWGRKRLAAALVIGPSRDELAGKTAQLIKLLNHPEEALKMTGLSQQDIRQVLERSMQYTEEALCRCFDLPQPDMGSLLNKLEEVSFHSAGFDLEFSIGDISTQHDIDIIVNATDSLLSGSGGSDRAVHRAAGPQLDKECKPLIPLETGQAVVTGAYWLPNRLIVHCVGPRYGTDENPAQILEECYRQALRAANERAQKEGPFSLAIPSIATGSAGYPLKPAAKIALETVLELAPSLKSLHKIRFVLADSHTLNIFVRTYAALLKP